MNQRTTPATPVEKIVNQAQAWRRVDKDAIAQKKNPDRKLAAKAQQAEYQARQQLRKVIDEADT